MIQVANLCKDYGPVTVLDNASLKLEYGKVHGIIGNNGAGKSTFFRCLLGLEDFEGSITGLPERVSGKIGFLPTTPHILKRITGKEYLHFLCTARKIKDVDYESRNIFQLPLDRYMSAYSTGMLKKLALMAILLQDNDFYILDEPYNGLDIESTVIVAHIVRRLREKGATVLVTSHIFASLADVCDHIHLLENGRFERSYNKEGFETLRHELETAIINRHLDKLW